MSKAEDLAKELFPLLETDKIGNNPYISYNTEQLAKQEGFIEGYRQAEKELIDKAIGWIKEINTHHHIMRYSDSCEETLNELLEWFKNYMEE